MESTSEGGMQNQKPLHIQVLENPTLPNKKTPEQKATDP